MRRPPPLQLLPAFEAASRLLSFSKAARELHVTTAAISQQIKQLEGHLGLSLFRRLTRRVELTEAGAQFAELVGRMLSSYRQGHADLLHRFTQP
ncbi:MAG: LysR family transcriptional regulator, partial [Aquabacterium sp.]|nr:LysR family transcriptional regulator [Aquabacterium sp.]